MKESKQYFVLIDDILWCYERTLIHADISNNYYRKEKCLGNKRLNFIDDPSDKRHSLVAFDTLSQAHQEKIKAAFGNPYEFIIRDPIMALIKNKPEAKAFFLNYTYNNKALPTRRIQQYTRACAVLDLVVFMDNERNRPIKDLGINVPTFYSTLQKIIEHEKANGDNVNYYGDSQLYNRFPTSYDRLRAKVEEYKTASYACVIDKAYGNDAALKVSDEVAEAQLLSLLENPNQHDDVMVCYFYNLWAKENGYKTIGVSTVFNWRHDNEQQIMMGREGNNAFNEKYIPQVKGSKPSAPLYLIEHDDNNLDLLFKDVHNYQFNKYVSINVVDSHCGLLLGKSYVLGQYPSQAQVYHAYLDAMYYIRSLTGAWHLPFEIKSDKWAIKSLIPFYEKIGNYVAPAHGNKHRGYIEPFFASPLWKRAQRLVAPENWTANNLTAKNPGVNIEHVKTNAALRPMVGNEAELQIEQFYYLLRHMPDIKKANMNAPSKEQQWLAAWQKLTPQQKRPISDEEFLLKFGIEPERTITITNRGVEPQINNTKYSYDMPEKWMYEKLPGEKVKVLYDPYDMSRVLITNHQDIRFIANTAQLSPRALHDTYTGSRTFLNACLADKKEYVDAAARKQKRRKELVQVDFNAADMLTSGNLPKHLKNEVEHKLIEEKFSNKREEWLNTKNDFSQFFE